MPEVTPTPDNTTDSAAQDQPSKDAAGPVAPARDAVSSPDNVPPEPSPIGHIDADPINAPKTP
ncbi:MAG: hypothetical protein WBA10_11460 [Elainellaceae cyanobacterium]